MLSDVHPWREASTSQSSIVAGFPGDQESTADRILQLHPQSSDGTLHRRLLDVDGSAG